MRIWNRGHHDSLEPAFIRPDTYKAGQTPDLFSDLVVVGAALGGVPMREPAPQPWEFPDWAFEDDVDEEAADRERLRAAGDR